MIFFYKNQTFGSQVFSSHEKTRIPYIVVVTSSSIELIVTFIPLMFSLVSYSRKRFSYKDNCAKLQHALSGNWVLGLSLFVSNSLKLWYCFRCGHCVKTGRRLWRSCQMEMCLLRNLLDLFTQVVTLSSHISFWVTTHASGPRHSKLALRLACLTQM